MIKTQSRDSNGLAHKYDLNVKSYCSLFLLLKKGQSRKVHNTLALPLFLSLSLPFLLFLSPNHSVTFNREPSRRLRIQIRPHPDTETVVGEVVGVWNELGGNRRSVDGTYNLHVVTEKVEKTTPCWNRSSNTPAHTTDELHSSFGVAAILTTLAISLHRQAAALHTETSTMLTDCLQGLLFAPLGPRLVVRRKIGAL